MDNCSKCLKPVAVEPFVCNDCQHRWIPVTEKLPDSNGFYIVYMNGGFYGDNVFFVTIFEFYNGTWRGRRVSHWMPLPKPPEEHCESE